MIQGLHTTRAPQIQILLHRSDGRRQQTTWTPDTGAEVSVISQEAAKQMGINVKKLTPPSGSLFAADGRELPCLGACQVALQLGSIKRTIAVSVVKKLHSSLLSWHDAVRLGILHKEFPQQIRSAISEEEETSRPAPAVCSLKTMPGKSKIPRRVVKRGSAPALEDAGKAQKLHPLKPTWDESKGVPSAEERRKHFSAMKEAFPRVFDVNSKLRKMSGGSMAIELTEDATPVAVSTARSVPFCWRDDIRRQLDELLESDVIEPVEHPTEWCHPILPVITGVSDGAVTGRICLISGAVGTAERPARLAMEGPPLSPAPADNVTLNVSCGRPATLFDWADHRLISLLALAFLNLMVVAGNLLVVMAVFVHSKLRTVTNLFIVSLACADLLVGMLVLPFSATLEVLDVWLYGDVWCSVWLAVDVWMCTSSILNLCAISLDRYLAVSQPISYPSLMSTRRAKQLIAAVWVLSFVICFPPLVGLERPAGHADRLAGLLGVPADLRADQRARLRHLLGSSAPSSCPAPVMLFFYGRIYRTAVSTTRAIAQGFRTTKEDEEGRLTLRIHRGRSVTQRAEQAAAGGARAHGQVRLTLSEPGARRQKQALVCGALSRGQPRQEPVRDLHGG
ncbi:putative G-protein coupled receptor No9 [Amphibalanus amphitrite]|uniref:Putative G-protein coupled receptor No9 n=1 Tax=Amphibalanus amphitrite TaxID=1232801 RepID=A0A6A4WL71_AMPAM|nr:putative G-protein coupled receptor No9 [Amphibalanus amphitrite]